MIVFLAEVTCYGCHAVCESTRSEMPRTKKDYEREFKITFNYKKVQRDGGEVWLCSGCQHNLKTQQRTINENYGTS